MFNQLFNCPRAVERHMTMPLVEQRLHYLARGVDQGATKQTLCHVAQMQLVVIEQLGLTNRILSAVSAGVKKAEGRVVERVWRMRRALRKESVGRKRDGVYGD